MTQQQVAYFKAKNDYNLGLLNAGINKQHYERSDTAAFQQARASLQNAESNRFNAESNRMNAFTNQRNADTNYRNALTNAYNADTNRYAANISLFNAETQHRLANVQEYNAQTSRMKMMNDYTLGKENLQTQKQANEINYKNALTNYQNAYTNLYNAETNRQVGIKNASTNAANAETNWYNAVTSRGQLGVSKENTEITRDRADAQNWNDYTKSFVNITDGVQNLTNTVSAGADLLYLLGVI